MGARLVPRVILAAWQDAVAAAPAAFLIGVAVGFVLSDRFRIVRRNGGSDHERERDEG
jgi:hypothetical protein